MGMLAYLFCVRYSFEKLGKLQRGRDFGEGRHFFELGSFERDLIEGI